MSDDELERLRAAKRFSDSTLMYVQAQADGMGTELEQLRARVQELLESNTKLVLQNRGLRAQALALAESGQLGSRRADIMAFFTDIDPQDIGASPHVPPEPVLRLRVRLLAEEFIEAVSVVFNWSRGDCPSMALLESGLMALIDSSPIQVDLPNLAHELTDVSYSLEAIFVACGIDSDRCWKGVHAANMSKAGGPRRESDGKLMKPPGFVPFDAVSALVEQGWKPDGWYKP